MGRAREGRASDLPVHEDPYALACAGASMSAPQPPLLGVCFACGREVPRAALTPEQICPDCAALPHFERTLLLLLNRISLDLTIIQRTLAPGPPRPTARRKRRSGG